MKLTKRKALEDCAKIWSELAKSGDKKKPGWASNKYSGHGCPCCAYADTQRVSCNECLLIGLWPETCCRQGSPYFNWDHTDSESDRKKYAKIIADYAKKLLKKVKKPCKCTKTATGSK